MQLLSPGGDVFFSLNVPFICSPTRKKKPWWQDRHLCLLFSIKKKCLSYDVNKEKKVMGIKIRCCDENIWKLLGVKHKQFLWQDIGELDSACLLNQLESCFYFLQRNYVARLALQGPPGGEKKRGLFMFHVPGACLPNEGDPSRFSSRAFSSCVLGFSSYIIWP